MTEQNQLQNFCKSPDPENLYKYCIETDNLNNVLLKAALQKSKFEKRSKNNIRIFVSGDKARTQNIFHEFASVSAAFGEETSRKIGML